MAVAFVAVGTTVSGTGATISVPFPASVTAGHYPLLFVESGNGTTPTAPAGWNLIWSDNAGSASSTDVGATKGYIYELSGKLADGTEGGTSVTVNQTTGHTVGKIIIWSGVDGTTPITFSTTTKDDGGSGTFTTDAIASKANDVNDMFHAFSFHDRDSSVAPSFGSQSFAGLTGETMTGRIVTSTASGGGGGMFTMDGAPAADSTGPVSFSCTFTSTIWVGALARLNATGSMGGGGSSGPVGMATETDTALALFARQVQAVGLATATSAALALGGVSIRATGLASSANAALALTPKQIRAVGLASETDTALALTSGMSGPVGLATSTNAAFALAPKQVRGVGLATDTSAALALTARQVGSVGLANETDTALALAAVVVASEPFVRDDAPAVVSIVTAPVPPLVSIAPTVDPVAVTISIVAAPPIGAFTPDPLPPSAALTEE